MRVTTLRRALVPGSALALTLALVPAAFVATDPTPAAAATSQRVGSLPLLTDPFLQSPGTASVNVVWMTQARGDRHVVLVGDGVASLSERELRLVADGSLKVRGVQVVAAGSSRLSRVAEDSGSQLAVKPTPAEGIVDREVWRHEAVVKGLKAGTKVPYRVVSRAGSETGASGTFRLQPLPRKGQAQKILLTSDHQAMINTPANLQVAAETVGDIDAVFMAGDLVNIPDRASEWFDDARGSAFFPVLQGRGGRTATNGRVYQGAPIVQNAPIYPAVGNHEVQGRRDGQTSLNTSYNAPVPKDVAERVYEERKAELNPTGNPKVKAQWIEDNSFSTTTYEEIFTLPESRSGGETYWATTIGDVRLVSLYSTRIWRGTGATANPANRTAITRYHESKASLSDPLAQGYGEHVFESLEEGSEQLEWLEGELDSREFRQAKYQVVIMHEGPQGLGDNVMPVFADPERIEERDAAGELVGVRYEYRTEDNMLVRDLQPLLEDAGVDLVHNGHSHLWNRFASESGTNYLETSNTGNSYGAYHPLSGRSRPVPPAPWDASNYLAQGNPGGLQAVLPTVAPLRATDGTPLPFVQSNDHVVFTVLDTGTGDVTSYVKDMRTPDSKAVVLDVFGLDRVDADLDAPQLLRHTLGADSSFDVTLHPGATGEVRLLDGDRLLDTATASGGRARLTLGADDLVRGNHTLRVVFAGDAATLGDEDEVRVTVLKRR